MKRIEQLNHKINVQTELIEKLDDTVISKKISLWNYKQPEFILLDEEYGSSFSLVVELYNITEDVIKFLKPIAYVTSTSGWTDLGSLTDGSFTSSFKYDVFMEEENYAKMYMSGVTIALATGFIPIPIYWTVKLFFNPIIKVTVI
ncbi:MAG: hypothetical protein WC906_05565 [Parcubacteria group bacterium]|jgi:hypothetical protein